MPKQPKCGRPARRSRPADRGSTRPTRRALGQDAAGVEGQAPGAVDGVVAGRSRPGRRLCQRDPGAGMPAPQLRRAVGVVGEQEVLDRVLHAAPAPLQVVADQRVDTCVVPAPPLRHSGGENHRSRVAFGARTCAGVPNLSTVDDQSGLRSSLAPESVKPVWNSAEGGSRTSAHRPDRRLVECGSLVSFIQVACRSAWSRARPSPRSRATRSGRSNRRTSAGRWPTSGCSRRSCPARWSASGATTPSTPPSTAPRCPRSRCCSSSRRRR